MGIPRAVAVGTAILGAWLVVSALAPTARAQVKLEYKYPEGQALTYKVGVKLNQVTTINGMEFPVDVDQTIVVSRAVGKRSGDGLPVRHKVEALRAEMNLPGGMQLTFDSKQPDAKVDNPLLAPLAEMMKLAGETDYTVILDEKHKVKAVEGAEKMQEKADKLGPEMAHSMRARFSAEKLRAEFEESHGNLPDVLARPGEPWERTTTIDGGGGEMVFRKKYEYAGTEKKGGKELDKITVKTIEMKLKSDPESQSPSKVTKSDLKVDSSDGTILFDRQAGRVVESRDKVRVKGPVTIAAAGQELAGELEFTIESTTELQPPAR